MARPRPASTAVTALLRDRPPPARPSPDPDAHQERYKRLDHAQRDAARRYFSLAQELIAAHIDLLAYDMLLRRTTPAHFHQLTVPALPELGMPSEEAHGLPYVPTGYPDIAERDALALRRSYTIEPPPNDRPRPTS